jgi:hypothetical protein
MQSHTNSPTRGRQTSLTIWLRRGVAVTIKNLLRL